MQYSKRHYWLCHLISCPWLLSFFGRRLRTCGVDLGLPIFNFFRLIRSELSRKCWANGRWHWDFFKNEAHIFDFDHKMFGTGPKFAHTKRKVGGIGGGGLRLAISRSYYIRNRADKDISYPHVLVRVTTDHEPAVPTCTFPRLASPAFHRRRRGFYLLLVANQSGVDLS